MKCPDCSAKLNNYETFWDCSECGYFNVKTKYAKLEEQNEKFLKKFWVMISQRVAPPAVIQHTQTASQVVLCSMSNRFSRVLKSYKYLVIMLYSLSRL